VVSAQRPRRHFWQANKPLTTEANAQMSALHHRMPVILEQADWAAWLGEAESDPRTLLRSAADGILRIWPVDNKVGDIRNDGAVRAVFMRQRAWILLQP